MMPGMAPSVVGLDGNDVAAVALGDQGALEGVLVGRLEKVLLDLAVDPLPGVGQLTAHLGQAGAGLIQNKVVGADTLLNDLGEGGQVPEIAGQGRQARGQIAPQADIVPEVPGQAQHLQDLVKGFGGQQAAPDGGLGQPGGQQGKIGEGDGAFTVLEFA